MFHRGLRVALLLTALAAGCDQSDKDVAIATRQPVTPLRLVEQLSPLDSHMITLGLVDVQHVAPTVLVDLKYSTIDNFTSTDMYGAMRRCYLQREVAAQVAAAQTFLDSTFPGTRLKIFDGARPMSVQKIMWDLVKADIGIKYVASPGHGSLHNFGAAVDVTLADSTGEELDMGTPFDSFDSLAQPRYEVYFRDLGQLTDAQIQSRLLLRRAMRHAGFTGILKEWWHFNAMPIEEAREKFKLIE